MEELVRFLKQYLYFEIFDKWGFPILLTVVIFLFVAETRWQLRKRSISRWKRIKRKVGLAAFALFVLRVALIPALVLAAKWAEDAGIGLLNWMGFKVEWLIPLHFSCSIMEIIFGTY